MCIEPSGQPTSLIHLQSDAYLEVIRASGPDIFDTVTDHYDIRALVAREQEIQEEIKEKLKKVYYSCTHTTAEQKNNVGIQGTGLIMRGGTGRDC